MDIVYWLRGMADMLLRDDIDHRQFTVAADEIELLRKERDGLREALKAIIEYQTETDNDGEWIYKKIAHAALNGVA